MRAETGSYQSESAPARCLTRVGQHEEAYGQKSDGAGKQTSCVGLHLGIW